MGKRNGSDALEDADGLALMRRRLGRAIRVARGDMPQAELGSILGDVPQTTLSRWETGKVDLSVEQVYRLERALGLRAGELLAAAGYIQRAAETTDSEAFLTAYHPSLKQALRAVKAADRLGIGVRLENAWRFALDGTEEMEWVVRLAPDAPRAERDSAQ